MRRLATAAALAGVFFLTSCVATHREFPMNKVGAAAPTKVYTKLFLHVDDELVDDSRNALREAIRTRSPFLETQETAQPPAQGVFVKVHIRAVPLGRTARLYRRISLATLTVIPSWTRTSGQNLTYEVFLDGTKMRNFDYQIRRRDVMWIGLAPFAWANLMTYGEAEAYEATALQFFDDADPFFRTATTPAP